MRRHHSFPHKVTSEKRLQKCHTGVRRVTTKKWVVPLIGKANFQSIRIPTQIWAVSRHQYGIFAVVPQTQFQGEISSGAAKISAAFAGYV